MSTEGKALHVLNVLRQAISYELDSVTVSVPGESEPGEFYVTWEGVAFAVTVEVMS